MSKGVTVAVVMMAVSSMIGTSSAVAADVCPNAAVRAQTGSGNLPDCRAYEMVTPGADKKGGGVGGALTLLPAQLAPSGERVVYPAYNPFGDVTHGMAGLGNSLAFVAERTSVGWKSTFVVDVPAPTPALQVSSFFPLWLGSSPDLSRQFLEVDYRDAEGFSSGAWVSEGGPASLLAMKDPSTTSFPTVVGSAFDGSSAVLSSPTLLGFGGPPPATGWVLYQERAGGLSLVNVDDTGQLLNATGAVLASRGSSLSGPGAVGSPRYAVSRDGSRVIFFSQRPGATPDDPVSLYVRVDGSRTLELTASVIDPTASPMPSSFVGASSDGTRIYFASQAQLLPDATGPGPFLYVYQLPHGAVAGTLRLVAGVAHAVSMSVPTPFGATGDFANIAVSDDGGLVYYANDEDGGSIFSYDVERDVTRRVASGVTDVSLSTVVSGQYYPAPDLSPDGRYLAFISTAPLVGDDPNAGRKLYLYDAVEDRLRLLSPSNQYTPSSFDVSFYAAKFDEADLSPNRLPAESNFVSDDGQYVFFGTDAPLVAGDTNGRPDVYRWHAGELALLTPGDQQGGGFLIGAGYDGKDALFYTTSSLFPDDGDDVPDIYDARMGGGFPGEAEAQPCAASSCQGPIAPLPAPPVAGSMTFTGSGNVAETSGARRSVSVSKTRIVTGSATTLKVTVPSAGQLELSGSGVAKAKRSVGKAAVYSLRVSLTTKARASLRKHKKLTAKVKVTFRPTSGSASSAHVTVRFKQRAAKTSGLAGHDAGAR